MLRKYYRKKCMASKISTAYKMFSEMQSYEILGYGRCVDEVLDLMGCPEARNLMKTLIFLVSCRQCEDCSSLGTEIGASVVKRR
jgi:hypothetical protein